VWAVVCVVLLRLPIKKITRKGNVTKAYLPKCYVVQRKRFSVEVLQTESNYLLVAFLLVSARNC